MNLSSRRWRAALASLLTAAVLATGMAVPAVADDLDDRRRSTESQKRQTDDALEDLHAHLEDTDAELLETQSELEEIQAAIPVAEAKLSEAEELLAKLQREAEILAGRLQDAEAQEESIIGDIADDTERAGGIRSAIGQMAREAYKGDMAASSLSAVLDAEDTEEFVQQSALASTALRTQTQALRDLEQITGVNRNREARLTAVREQITVLKAEADEKVVEAEEARAEAEEAKLELESLHEQQQEKLATIEAKRDEQLAKKAEYEAQQAALASELKKIIAAQEEERRKEEERRRKAEAARKKAEEEASRNNSGGSGGGSSGGSSGGSGGSSGGGGSSSDPLSWPVPSPVVVTSSYGYRIHPVYGYRKLHAGTDFRAYCGNPIIAARSGTVQWAYYRGGFGNQVMVNHGYYNGRSLMTSYNHLSRFAVSSGQRVSKGQVLGYSGTTGTSTACHLHFEVYVDGSTKNPMSYL